MTQVEPSQHSHAELLAEVDRLRQEVLRLQQENSDLHIALQTTTEHGDLIETQLHAANQQLQAEVAERKQAQMTLHKILETIIRDKTDLELILDATARHGDMLEYQLYTQAVETMRQNEELFRAIAESTSMLMILTHHPSGIISYANSISGERLGLESQQLIGHQLEEFFANPDDVAQVHQLLEQQGYVRNYEMRVRHTDGHLFWVSLSVHPLALAGRRTRLTTLYDISDRIQAEAALRQSEEQLRQQAQELEQRVELRTQELRQAEEKYRGIFENAAEGIFQMTPTGQYLSVNPALADILGYESVEQLLALMTNADRQLYVQPRRRDELIAYLRRFGSVVGFESEVYCHDGATIWISENVRAVHDAEGKVVLYEGSVRDITDRKSAEEELRRQRQVSERLLLNVLPQLIAERLKRRPKTIADSFNEVTVLFADIVNFTEFSSRTSPIELVELLNNIFSAFDQLADDCRLEKIKTIGDAYMVVGGLPRPQPDHLTAMADMALGMLRAIRQFRTQDGEPITLRIGIHTGPVVAGVIGTRKFIYDLWGDTVNIASRMESQGEPGQIQVTDTVYERLHKRYTFEPRGTVEIKGKGLMTTYWLTGRKGELR